MLARYLRGIADQARSMPHPERLSRRTHGYRRIGSAIPDALLERAKQAGRRGRAGSWPSRASTPS